MKQAIDLQIAAPNNSTAREFGENLELENAYRSRKKAILDQVKLSLGLDLGTMLPKPSSY